MRKFLSLLLAMCLMFSLCMTSAAAVGNDAIGDGSSDILNVRVPDEISLHMDQDGHVQAPQTLAIENLSAKPVRVASIHVEGKDGWSVVDWTSDFSGKLADTKDLAMSFRGDGTDDVGDVALSDGNWDISEGGSLLIDAAVKMPMQAETDKTSIATVYWSIDWSDDGPENPSGGFVVSVLPGEHGSCDVNEITTGSDGKIVEFPGVTPDEGYLFDHWEDQDGNLVDENMVLDDGDSIRPVFKPDPDWNPDKTVTVPVLPGENGSCDVNEITTGSDGKISEFPSVTPDAGYVFDHWTDGDGNFVSNDTMFTVDDALVPVFVPNPDIQWNEFTVLYNNLYKFGMAGADDLVIPARFEYKGRWYVTTRIDGPFSGTLGSISIPDTVRSIGDRAFANATFLSGEVVIPDSVTSMGEYVFENCKVDRVVFSSGMTSIPYGCFKGSTLSEFDIPDSVKRIDHWAFHQSGLVSVTIPDSVTSMGSDVFSYNDNLEHITFSKNCPVISECCCLLCPNLQEIVIPEGVTKIDYRAFFIGTPDGRAPLTSVVFPDGLTYIGDAVFHDRAIQDVYVPDSVTYIGYSVFHNVDTLHYAGPFTGEGRDEVNFGARNWVKDAWN